MIPRSRRGLAIFAGVAVAVQLVLDLVHTYGPPAPGALVWPLDYLPQVEAPFWAGYFALGCLIGAEYPRLRALWRWWPAGVVLTAAGGALVVAEGLLVPNDWWRQGSYAFLWPSRLPATLALVAAVLWFGRLLAARLRPFWGPIERLSRHSLGVYIVQVLVLWMLGAYTGAWPAGPRLVFLVVGSLAIAYVAVVLLARTRWGALSIGEQPPPKRSEIAGSSAPPELVAGAGKGAG